MGYPLNSLNIISSFVTLRLCPSTKALSSPIALSRCSRASRVWSVGCTLPDALKYAIEMPDAEKKERMGKMQQILAENNIYRWAGKFISNLLELE